jgi:SAM-dependent methyltransferase
MFAVEPDRAIAEIHRVLRPGGRFAAAVWGRREDNPWLGVVFDAVSAQTGSPIPPPGIPGPFALGDTSRLRALLTAAGFADVTIDELPVPLRAPSFDAWWERTIRLAGPLATVVSRLPEAARTAVVDQLRRVVDPFTSPSGLELPGLALVASGVRR